MNVVNFKKRKWTVILKKENKPEFLRERKCVGILEKESMVNENMNINI